MLSVRAMMVYRIIDYHITDLYIIDIDILRKNNTNPDHPYRNSHQNHLFPQNYQHL